MATARNPIIAGFAPDPSICRRGDDFYVVTSSFNYRPGLPVYHSRDLASWQLVGHALTTQSQFRLPFGGPSEGIFAATIRCVGGWFYVTCTNTSFGGNFVVRTEDPMGGEWSEPLWIDRAGIDPGLALCDDGRVLLATTATGGGVAADLSRTEHEIVVSEIDLDTGQRLSDVHTLTRGWQGQYPEGPRFVKRGDFWYLLLAEGGTEFGHMVTVGRARDPAGPYQPCPRNPVLTHRSQYDPIQATGHADMVEAADGTWWMVCLGIRPTGHPPTHVLGRETFLCPVEWVDDWPVVGVGGRVPRDVRLPWAPRPVGDANGSINHWNDPHWTTLGDPVAGAVVVEPSRDVLRLASANSILGDGAFCSARFLPQRHLAFEATTRLRSLPEAGAEAGLTIWMDRRHHYQVGVEVSPEGPAAAAPMIVARRTVGSISGERRTARPGPDGPVTLRVASDGDVYTLGWVDSEGCAHEIDRGETRYLSSEVAGGFTGVMLGPYVAGKSGATAEFEAFDYRTTNA